jgi:tetratricopeptide (TPR) repeat protein
VLNGTIAQIGTRYLLTLKAGNCSTGETLASTEAEANDKNQVLDALGTIGSDIRRKLGESLATVEKYDVTLREATTPSVEALRAFSLGERFLYQGDNASAPYFQRALELDPNFAMAYMQLGIAWMSQGEPGRARESFAKAFSLREHTSEREKLQIDSAYYGSVTGELDKAIQSLQQVIEIYKHTPAYHGLVIYYSKTGQYEKSADAARILLAHDVDRNFAFYRLAIDEIALQNFNEARKVIERAQASGVDDSLHGWLYLLAFLQSDPAGMAEQQSWFAGHGDEIYAFELAANTEAYAGHLAKARELTRLAADAAMQEKNMGSAASNAANGALRDAAYGALSEARREAADAVKLAPGDPSVMTQAALAFAMSRERARAESLVQELNKHSPLNTQVQLLSIPAIEAQLQLGGGQTDAVLKTLHGGLSIEYADTQPGSANLSCLYATYIRGEMYLAAGRGAEAAGEFTKIIDHNGIVGNCWTGALAHLGVARANALQWRTSQGADADAARIRALAAYKDFLALWKDADPDIPILKEAKAEYAKLQ